MPAGGRTGGTPAEERPLPAPPRRPRREARGRPPAEFPRPVRPARAAGRPRRYLILVWDGEEGHPLRFEATEEELVRAIERLARAADGEEA